MLLGTRAAFLPSLWLLTTQPEVQRGAQPALPFNHSWEGWRDADGSGMFQPRAFFCEGETRGQSCCWMCWVGAGGWACFGLGRLLSAREVRKGRLKGWNPNRES